MDLKRIKTVMIVILLAINAFLIYNIASDYFEKNYIDDATLQNTAQILSRSGIDIDLSCVPSKKLTSSIYESFFLDDYNEKAAVLLSGSEIENAFSVPDGMRFVAKNGDQIEFSDRFGVVFTSAEANRYIAFSEIISSAFAMESLPVDKDDAVVARLKDLLSSDASPTVGYAKMDVSCTGNYFVESTGYRILKFTQTMDKVPVYGHDVFCVIEGEKLIYMEGIWSFLPTDAKYSSQLYDQVNILFMEKKSIDQIRADREKAGIEVQTEYRVEKVDSVYCTYFNDGKTGVYFIPAWRITYDDGSESVYDAQSGIKYVGVE